MQRPILTAFLTFLLVLSSVAVEAKRVCKVLPQDSQWPNKSEWDALNQTVGGRLISNVPIAAPCHQSSQYYNAAECQVIQENWHIPEFQYATFLLCSPVDIYHSVIQ